MAPVDLAGFRGKRNSVKVFCDHFEKQLQDGKFKQIESQRLDGFAPQKNQVDQFIEMKPT